MCVCLVTQSCPILWDPMNCSPPSSSFHRISQARILEWVAISFSRGSSPPGDQTPYLPETLRGLKHILCAPGPRDPTETETELCLGVSWGGTGQQWPATGAGALGAAGLGMAQALLEEVTINPTIELLELTQDWGNRLLEGTNRTLCAPELRRKEQWPHKRLTQTCPWGSRSLRPRRGLVVACCRAGGTEGKSVCLEPFEGGYLHYLHYSLASGQIAGKEHSPSLQQKID